MERFASVNEANITSLLKEKNSDNTHKATNVAWNIYTSYLEAKSLDVVIESASLEELNNILRKFFVEVRKL